MLVLFAFAAIINNVGWIAFAPLGDILMDNYNVSIYEINYLSQSFMLAYPIMN